MEALTDLHPIRAKLDKIQSFLQDRIPHPDILFKIQQAQLDQMNEKLNPLYPPSLRALTQEQDIHQLRTNIQKMALPDFTQELLSDDFQETIHWLVDHDQKLDEIQDLREEHSTQLQDAKEAVDYLISEDKPWFLRLFRSRDTKDKIQANKNELKSYLTVINDLDQQVNSLQQTSISQEEALRIFHYKPNYYLDSLSQCLDYPQETPDALVEAIDQEIRRIGDKHKTAILYLLRESVRIHWERAIDEVLLRRLGQKSILALRKQQPDAIDWYKLGDLTSATLQRVYRQSATYLAQHSKLSAAEAHQLKQAIDQYAQEISSGLRPRFDPKDLSGAELQVLALIDMLATIPAHRLNELEAFSTVFQQALEAAYQIKELSPNDYQDLFLSDEEKVEKAQLYKDLIAGFNQLIPLVDNTDLAPIPNKNRKALIEDFRQDSAKYFALLDQILNTGQKQGSDLPDHIVEAVQAFELDQTNLIVNLRPYQLFGTQYSLHFKKTLLGDEMGLGKTIQAIAAINHLAHQGKKHAIVICPLSVLTNWVHEIKRWCQLTPYIYRPPHGDQALDDWLAQGGILLFNYERAVHLLESEKLAGIDIVIADEAHMIKNPAAKRTRNTSQLIKAAEYALLMTGTPIENRLGEMKHLVSVLNPALGQTLTTGFGVQDSNEFKRLTASVYLRRKRDEVLKELPEIETVEMWSQLNARERQTYNEAVLQGVSGLMMMRRAAFVGGDPAQSEKVQQIQEICLEAKENGDKVIIFSYFKKVLYPLLNYINPVDTIGVISGDISAGGRQELIDEFTQADDGAILLSQIDSGGVGLNIQAANIVILCEPQWKPSTENQAIGRVYRMGQTKNVIVYRLLSEECIDESILRVLGEKTDIFNTYAHDSLVSDAFDQKVKEMSENEVQQQVLQIERERLERSIA